jgi:hypothetical protein
MEQQSGANMFLDIIHRPILAEWNLYLAFVLMAMTNEPLEVGMWSTAVNIPTNFQSNTAYKSIQIWWGDETLRLCLNFSVSRICMTNSCEDENITITKYEADLYFISGL